MPFGGLLTAGVVAGSLAYGVGSNISKNRKAKEREQALGGKPVYNIQEPTLKNQSLAEYNAQQGLSDEAKMIYENSASRGLSDSIDALLKVGGGINSVSDLYSKYQDKGIELATLDDQIRFRNQQLLMNQNEKMANELDKSYQINKLDPWKDEKQAIAELRTIARNDLNAGIGMAANATMAGAGMMSDMKIAEGKPKQNVSDRKNIELTPLALAQYTPNSAQKTNNDWSMYARPSEQNKNNEYLKLIFGLK
jgi:hypothetical protein